MTDTTDQERAKIKAVANSWQNVYRRHGYWDERCVSLGKTPSEIHAEILACNTLDEVDAVIGNKSWTHEICSACSTKTRDRLAVFDVNDGEYDYSICAACLRAALDELSEE